MFLIFIDADLFEYQKIQFQFLTKSLFIHLFCKMYDTAYFFLPRVCIETGVTSLLMQTCLNTKKFNSIYFIKSLFVYSFCKMYDTVCFFLPLV